MCIATNSGGSITVPSKNGRLRIYCHEIIYFEADGASTIIHLVNGGKITVTPNLAPYCNMLNCLWYYRIHDKFYINMYYFESYHCGDITLKNHEHLPVSRNKKRSFLDYLKSANMENCEAALRIAALNIERYFNKGNA